MHKDVIYIDVEDDITAIIGKIKASKEQEDNHHRYIETTLENSHFNIYREHMMGQPIKGDRDNI